MAERITVNSKKPVSIKENPFSHKRKTDFQSDSSPVNRILYLQRTIGNQAVQRMVRSGALQAKLRIGQPGDVYEQEADRVADAVMRMPEPGVQRQVEPEEEEEPVQAKAAGSNSKLTPSIESGINSIRSGGQPFSEITLAIFEPRFGADFSGVKVHTDTNAAHLARSINAKAFTLGRNVVFGSGQYSPETSAGKRLMAHELTHVVQQGAAPRVSHIKASRKGEAPVRPRARADLRDGTDVVRMAPANPWKILLDIKGKADELKDVLGKDVVSDDLYKELTNPKPTRIEKWADLLIKHWGRRLAQNNKDLLYVGLGAITAYSRLVKKKDVVGLIDKSVDYSRWARNNMRESKRSSKLKLKYQKAYRIVSTFKKAMLRLYGITHDMKYFIQHVKAHRLKWKFWRIYRIHRERARVLAQTARKQTNIAKIFDKASDKIDKELSPSPKRSRSGSYTPSIIDVIKGLSRIL